MGRKGDETKSWIKAKARTLFEMRGFHRVTMKDVCEITGLSRGGLYGNYESTEQIFAAIIDDLMTIQNDELQQFQAQGISASVILAGILNRYREEMLDGDHSLSLAIYEYYSLFPKESGNPLSERYEESKKMWGELLQYGIDTGEFYAVDIDAVYDLLVFSYQGVRMYSAITEVDTVIPERIIGIISKMIIKESAVLLYETGSGEGGNNDDKTADVKAR